MTLWFGRTRCLTGLSPIPPGAPTFWAYRGKAIPKGDALADILSAMAANVFDPWPADSPIFQDTQTAADEMAELMRELGDDGTNYRLHRVTKDDLRAAYRPVSDAVPVA